ncbi:MAG: hypothetical protein H0X51_10000 [Parachlamydiaceae bacterium]|nr:hypothetical protein [Parachlamydiaceae bacterium]
MTSNDPNRPEDKKPSRQEDRKENFYDYAKTNTRDMIAYVMMILGIILLFFQPLYGGLIIGVVVGVYFAKEIIALLKDYETFIDSQGLVRSLVLGGTLLAFFISAPAIFIGAAVVVFLRLFLVSEDTN